MPTNKYLHEVAITAIVIKDGKYLLLKRSASKRRFPNKWTVPGGKLETSDYDQWPKDTEFYWYNVLERTLRREVKEETGLEIGNIEYVTSLATIHEDGNPSLVISCKADLVSGKVTLNAEESSDYIWADLKQAKSVELLDGIYEELVMVEEKLKGIRREWQR